MIRRALVSTLTQCCRNNGEKPILRVVSRSFASKGPGSNPLEVFQKECFEKGLCDEGGERLPGVHWVVSLAIPPKKSTLPPSLRTVGLERASLLGFDFVMKNGSPTAMSVEGGTPVSFLHHHGKYVPGSKAEQWRAEGVCQRIRLSEVLDLIPAYTVTSMVGSTRVAKEQKEMRALAEKLKTENKGESVEFGEVETDSVPSGDRLAMLRKSHLHIEEVMTRTRRELENGDITMEELDECIAGFRFVPSRMENMVGGPDSIMWDRWEWVRTDNPNDPHTKLEWKDASHLVPH